GVGSDAVARLRERLVAPPGLHELLAAAIDEAPPLSTKEGGFIRRGFSPELDQLKALRFDIQGVLADLQRREIERSGIATLKVGFNSVFGYYLEITHANRERVPADYVRKQTLKNAERYITPELKDYETTVLNAEERSKEIEVEVFREIRARVAEEIAELQDTARALAALDALGSLAQTAREQNYAKPDVDESLDLE